MLPCLLLAYGAIDWADIVAGKLRRRREWVMLHTMWSTCYSIAARFDTKDHKVS